MKNSNLLPLLKSSTSFEKVLKEITEKRLDDVYDDACVFFGRDHLDVYEDEDEFDPEYKDIANAINESLQHLRNLRTAARKLVSELCPKL